MPLPVYNVGQVLGASDVNGYFLPKTAYKAADTSRGSTTLANDPDLQVSFDANAVYLFHGYLLYTAVSGGDIQWTFTGFAGGAALRYAPMRQNLSGAWAGAFADTGGTVETANGQGTGTLMNAILFGTFATGTSGGTLILQWAQNVNTGTTVLKAQSALCLQRIQ